MFVEFLCGVVEICDRMTRIKIKYKGPVSRESKRKLLDILCSKGIHIHKVFSANDGFALLTLNEEHADNVFSNEVKQELESKGFTAVIPPELRVKKSIIITRVDEEIYDRSEDEIIHELLAQNTWIDEIHTVYKFPNSSTIKVTFNQTSIAKLCTQKGLLAFRLSIPASDIKQETFVEIKTCTKCYKLEDHATKDCPRGREYKVCSECSREGHQWFQCRDETKTCINCSGNHSTMAMRCTVKKTLIKEKRKDEIEKSKMTYAGTTQSGLTQHRHPVALHTPPTPIITKEEALLIHICVAHAHHRNIQNPGSYEAELNAVLKANKLPSIIIPDTTESQTTPNIPPQQTQTNT